MESDAVWLRSDPLTEGVKGLTMTRRMLEEGQTDAYHLKWAVFAVVNATEGFVVASHRSVEVLTWDSTTREQLRAWDRGERDSPPALSDVRMPPFRQMLEKVRELGWDADEDTEHWASELAGLRDAFMHFKNIGWSVAADGMRQAIWGGAAAVRFLLDRSTSNMWPDDEMMEAAFTELREVQRLCSGSS